MNERSSAQNQRYAIAQTHAARKSHLRHRTHIPSSLRIILIIKRIDRNSNLLIQPIPAALLAHGDKRAIRTSLQRDTHSRPLLADGLDIIQFDIPLARELLRLDKHDAIVGEHDEQVFALELQVGNVVFVEVFAVVEGLEPELAERLALGVGTHDAVHADEPGESDAVEAFLVEYGGGVADALGHV